MTTSNQTPPSAENTTVSSSAGLIMSPYIPYIIAGSFVLMTALLTLLLTAVMDNRAELEQTLAQQTNTLLPDARQAFGLTETVEPVAIKTPALPNEIHEIDLPASTHKTTEIAETKIAALSDLPKKQDNNSTETTVIANEIVPVSTLTKDFSKSSRLIENKFSTTKKTDEAEITKTTNTMPTIIKETAMVTTNNKATLPETHIDTGSLNTNSEELTQIEEAHASKIQALRNAIFERQENRRLQIDNTITYNLQRMEMQIRMIENRIRPAYPPAIAAYQNMVDRRRQSFHRMMQRRNEMLQRVYETRNRLREHYSQLLRLLTETTNGIT